MTFDDELKHAFEALTARLQTELERQIDAAKAVLAAAAPPPSLPPAPKEEEPAPSARGAEADERLVEGIRSIDNARSLSEILDALASAAARDASRVAVLLTSGGEWRAWRTSGFDQEPDVATLAAVAADATHDSRGRVRLPLAISGETVGALYAEDGRLTALEILVRHAARCLESMTAFKTARAMLANGFYPDTISSDIHQLCIDGPAFDQVTTMSKFLCLGMELPDVIAASTANAAFALRRLELGSLKPGSTGDDLSSRNWRSMSLS